MGSKRRRRRRHVPQRTCVGCRAVLAKKDLLRIVRTPEGVKVDPTGRAAGRGAYLHNNRSCWQRALEGGLSSSLKVRLSASDLERLNAHLESLPGNTDKVEDA